MSSDEGSSDIDFGDDDEEDTTPFRSDDEDEEVVHGELVEKESRKVDQSSLDDDDFESITGFGIKAMPTSRSRGGSIHGQGDPSNQSSKTKSLEVFITPFEEDDEDKIKELYTNTFVENGPHGLGIMDALQIAVVLEEMSDQLDIIGMSIDAPQVDLRSKVSADTDILVHRPRVTIPATLDPYSNSFFKEKYILRQHYSTVAARRIEQMCNRKKDDILSRRRLTLILRDFGVNRCNMKGKTQGERTQMTIILDNVITELIQDLTFNSLIHAIDSEKEKYEGMKEKLEKSLLDKHYITESMDTLKKLRIEKKKAKKELQNKLWEFEGNRQELLKRKELEYLFVNYNGLMTKARMKKMCAKSEKAVKDVLDNEVLKKDRYEYAHYLMLDIIYKKYKEAQRRLEHWVEMYEKDKETLQAELDQMKADRERDLKRIDWLKAMITDYEQIAVDDRRMKKITYDRARQERIRNRKAVKIQAWWRGEMYRKKLGPYSTKAAGKGKGKGKDAKKK